MSFGISEIEITDTSKGIIISVWIMGKYCHTEFGKTQTDVDNYIKQGYGIRPKIRKE